MIMDIDDVIKVLEEFKRNPQNIQIKSIIDMNGWYTIVNDLHALLIDIGNGAEFRIKPAPKYIPWTTDDWKEFSVLQIFDNAGNLTHIESWCTDGVYFSNGTFEYYGALLEYGWHYFKENSTDEIPCGKIN